MKKLTIYLIILIIFCVGFYFLCYKTNYKSPIELVGTARLMEDGSVVKINTGQTKGGLGLVFLFLDRQNNIINTLSVENSNISGPDYRIVKGNNHDWLVITTIGKNGTGYIEYIDTWYLVTGWYGDIQKVLTYTSKVMEDEIINRKEITTEVVSNSTNDTVLEIKFITKTCSEKDVCKTSSQTNRYVWDLKDFKLAK